MKNKMIFLFALMFNYSFYSGFAAETLVQQGDCVIKIDSLSIDDDLVSYDGWQRRIESVKSIKKHTSSQSVLIIIENESIVCALDQCFLLPFRQQWVFAKDIQVGDELLQSDGATVAVNNIATIDGSFELYDITVEPTNSYCVTNHCVVVHNFPAVFVTLSWSFGGGFAFEGVKFAVGFMGVWIGTKLFKKKSDDGDGGDEIRVGPIVVAGSPDPEDPDDWKKKYPNGRETGCSHHHKNSKGGRGAGAKNPSPKNAQSALDTSVKYSENSPNRVGVSDGEYVVSERTAPAPLEFHSHVRSWSELTQEMRNALYKHGLVESIKTGKIKK